MNILDYFEKNAEIERYLDVLEIGAKYLGADFKISQVFSADKSWSQLPSFYGRKDMTEEAKKAINWWRSLSPELQHKYDR
ncbi:hypothetical protein [Citrobacter portucalensis]|uniref:hypothetical protein n=1 Tax=Citrobacter portucalensis TaxID=1639133 RepID=UPI001BAA9F88|nr:hypothetical protein [Citrobacter portucalensis]